MTPSWIRVSGGLLVLLAVAATTKAQQGDRIIYLNRANKAVKEDVLRGQIKEETPKEITIARGTRTEKISAADVLHVDHQIPADLNIDIRAKAAKEEATADNEPDTVKRLKGYDLAITGYRDLLEKLGKQDSYPLAKRHLEFKIAQLLAREAEDDSARLDATVTALADFKSNHNASWQIGQTGKLLARAQIAKGDMKGALATFEEFARRDDLADEVRQEYQLLGIKALIRTDNFADAELKLTKLAAILAKDDPQAVRVEIYLAACKAKTNLADAEKRLQAVIASDADVGIKALAYNSLGDCYRSANRLEDAFWQYLWVDQQYNQDREEYAKALYHLSILFDRVKKTPGRAQACRQKLLNDKLFAGLDYQKLAAKEANKPSTEK